MGNLDRVGDLPDTKVSLYAVFDGHGGDEASHLASQNLHKRFLHHLSKRVQARHLDSTPGLPSAGAKETPGTRIREFVNTSTPNASRTDAAGELFVHSALGVVLKEALAEALSDVESSFLIVSCRLIISSPINICGPSQNESP